MLGRYKIHRGKRPAADPLPEGIRQDTRWRTKHPLRPGMDMVEAYLASRTDAAWRTFRRQYLALLETRVREDPEPFDKLAALARQQDVWLGCSCPTRKNPDGTRCHTVAALEFMKARYPSLRVVTPE